MTDLSPRLCALVDAERSRPPPSADLASACWQRIADDAARGNFPTLDVPPPPRRHGGKLLLAFLVIGGALAAATYFGRADPPAVLPRPDAPPPRSPAPITIPSVAQTPPPLEPPHVAPAAPSLPLAPTSPPPSPVREAPPTRPSRVPSGDADTFAAELRLIAAGQAALTAGDHAAALRQADLHKKTFPNGHFSEDRDALRVIALCGSQAPRWQATARTFTRSHPRSIHLDRIREACGLDPAP